jgi:hypothetical protein
MTQIRIPVFKKTGTPPADMTSYGLGEMFKGDFADMCGEKIPPV